MSSFAVQDSDAKVFCSDGESNQCFSSDHWSEAVLSLPFLCTDCQKSWIGTLRQISSLRPQDHSWWLIVWFVCQYVNYQEQTKITDHTSDQFKNCPSDCCSIETHEMRYYIDSNPWQISFVHVYSFIQYNALKPYTNYMHNNR